MIHFSAVFINTEEAFSHNKFCTIKKHKRNHSNKMLIKPPEI